MKKLPNGTILYSPSDLIVYLASPFASWMDRYDLENPGVFEPDEETEDQKLIIETGNKHEQAVLTELRESTPGLSEIDRRDRKAIAKTLEAVKAEAPIIYQAALEAEGFAGFADFMILDERDRYQIWDTKLARSPKPYYAIQLCCYSYMFSAVTGEPMPEKFGVILGTNERVAFRTEDFIHYYRRVRTSFLRLQDEFSGNLDDRPEPLTRADHGHWSSHAEEYFEERDHLVRVAGISVGQIKKLKAAEIKTMTDLAAIANQSVPKLAADTLDKLAAQARLQCETQKRRVDDPEAQAIFEIIQQENGSEPTGLAALQPENAADVFFDMEGYPIVIGGLEYLFGASARNEAGKFEYLDWWAHNRQEEKHAFEGFIDWVFARWCANPGMHIYHYAPYEVSAVRRLSTRHDTRQDEVDELLRHEVFVDLYQIVRQGLRIGEDSYSIKKVELLYRPKRETEVASGTESIVQYARWMESGDPADCYQSPILKEIRDYNEDDCRSTAELFSWLKKLAAEHGIEACRSGRAARSADGYVARDPSPEQIERSQVAEQLRQKGDKVSVVLADLVDFHRREEKPMWWRMFDRAKASSEELKDDNGCIADVIITGDAAPEKQSVVQGYGFDPRQECKLAAGKNSAVMFAHNLQATFNLFELNLEAGSLRLKTGTKTLAAKFDAAFPADGSLFPFEYVSAEAIQKVLTEVAKSHITDQLAKPAAALLERGTPILEARKHGEKVTEAGIRIATSMEGACLIIQGPPGTGKTYTASHMITRLQVDGKRVGVTSNSHKAIDNLLRACGAVARDANSQLQGIKVGGDGEGPVFDENPHLVHVSNSAKAADGFTGGVAGGTAWLFCRPEWEGKLDFLFVDEAGQVSLANVIAMSRCTNNLVLLGDQMQLEQPIQGCHPGDAGMSALQYALKDLVGSKEDLPVYHAVVPPEYGLFLGESWRMNPDLCSFISDSIYEGRLTAHPDCQHQRISVPKTADLVRKECGIVFSGIEHDGNTQSSDEEVGRVIAIFEEMLGRDYTDFDRATRPLELNDFLFVTPYNAQVRALQAALPGGARVGSVDKFQGQEAPVCILSLCSSCGEYGTRGLGFILDRNRINVAISRARCLAIVVADPRIAHTNATSLDEMRLLNLFCKISC